MLNLNMIKNATSIVVGLGTGKIVSSIIKNNVEPETIVDTVTIAAGSLVIGGMVADAAKVYTDKTIDQIAEFIIEFIPQKNKTEEA